MFRKVLDEIAGEESLHSSWYQLELDINCNAVPTISKDSDKLINESLMQMITKDLQSLSIVENEGFRGFVAVLNPNYKIPSSSDLASSLLKEEYAKKLSIINMLIESVENICISIESWTSINNEAYISLTGHFISSEWEHKSVYLSCFKTLAGDTSEDLRCDIKTELEKWKIHDKVICVVCDSAIFNVVEAIKLAGFPQVECIADTLNLVVTDAFKVTKIHEIIKKCNLIVEYIDRSPEASHQFRQIQCQMGMLPLKMINSTPTRWQSTLEMWQRFLENRDALTATEIFLNNPSVQNLSSYEWETIKELMFILKPFNEISAELSGERYATLSKVLILVHGLQSCLAHREKLETNNICAEVLRDLIKNIKIRFMNFEYNEIYATSSFLDPRFKCLAFTDTVAFKYCREETELFLDICNNELEDSDGLEENCLDNSSIWQEFDRAVNSSKSVVENYINEELLYRKECPLLWWKKKNETYPGLALLAKKYLAIVATAAATESAFATTAGNKLCERRSSLENENIKEILFVHYNQNI